jgi:membrane protein DedA with SNARE-associated domain
MSSYEVVFLLLLAGGIGIPMPEERPLLYGGIAAAHPDVSLLMMFGVCYAGVMIGDTTMFFLGYFFGNKLLDKSARSPFLPLVTPEKIEEVREGLRKRRLLYLFIGRHLFFLRSVTFVAAGALRIPLLEFLLSDSLAALVSVAIFLGIGYLFGSTIPEERLMQITHQVNIVILLVLLVGGGGYYLLRRYRRVKSASLPRENG